MFGTYVRAFLVLLFVISFFGTSPQTTQAIESGGFGGRPAFPQADNPRTESIFVHTLKPGQVQDEGVRVINNSAETKTLLVYAADSVRSTDGAFACKQMSDGKTDVGSWITLERGEVILPPQSNVIVPFTVSIPASASVGEHNGCILIQEKKAKTQNVSGAVISVRTGLRVAITVPGAITRELTAGSLEVTRRSGDMLMLVASATNNGNVSIDTDVAVGLNTLFGTNAVKDGGRFPVLRDETSTWNFEVPEPFWGGWYIAYFDLIYDANPEAKIGVDTRGHKTTLHGDTRTVFVMPHWIALIVYIVALFIILFVLRLCLVRHNMKKAIQRTWVKYEIKEGDTLAVLSRKLRISWKLLAKVNNLKAPYLLQSGDQIRVPNRRKRAKSGAAKKTAGRGKA